MSRAQNRAPKQADSAPAAGGNTSRSSNSEAPVWAESLLAAMAEQTRLLSLLVQRGEFPPRVNPWFPSGSLPTSQPAATRPQGEARQQPAKQDAKPKLGESGSGYTRISNGRLVRNKRPMSRPLVERQARNWRSKATKDLVSFLKSRNIGPNDPKPSNDGEYKELVQELASAKAFSAYVKSTQEPLEVQDWREVSRSVPSTIVDSKAEKPSAGKTGVSPASGVKATGEALVGREANQKPTVPQDGTRGQSAVPKGKP